MKKVEPQVYCIGEMSLNKGQLGQWLRNNKWEECLEHITGTPNEQLIEFAGRSCYKSFKVGGENSNPNISRKRENSEEYILNILKSFHGSVLEHGYSTWAIENCSRIVTHELVRHRAGTAFSQQSGRYIRIDDISYWLPPEIEDNDDARKVFEDTMKYLEERQIELAHIFDIDNMKSFAEKKKLTSAFRRIAPIGIATGIVVSFNMRALRWVIENRTSEHAEIEIRIVFNKIAEIALKRWPMIFQDFERQETEDGPPVWVPKYRKV